MNVAIVNLTSSLSHGYKKHLRAVLPAMLRDPRVSDVRVFEPAGCSWEREGCATEPLLDRTPDLFAPRLQHALRDFGADVVFVPTARLPRITGIPTVVMVRNMEPLSPAMWHNAPPGIARNIIRRVAAKSACRRASRIIAVSEHVSRFLTENWHIRKANISVIYHGVSEDNGTCHEAPSPAPERKAFYFVAGSIRPARGIEDAIQALAQVPDPKATLVVAGAGTAGPKYDRQLRSFSDRIGVGNRVRWLGHVPPPQMAWCFHNCRAFLMTSRVEACPNIVLEALAASCSIISTRCEPMQEFLQNCAVYYDAGNANQLAAAMCRVDRDGIGGVLREEYRRNLKRFSWDRTAAKTVGALEAALDRAVAMDAPAVENKGGGVLPL